MHPRQQVRKAVRRGNVGRRGGRERTHDLDLLAGPRLVDEVVQQDDLNRQPKDGLHLRCTS